MNRFLSAILLTAAASSAAVCAQTSVTTALDSTNVIMGSQLHMTVNVTMPQSDAQTARILNLPEIQNQQEGYGIWYGVQVVDIAPVDTVDEGNLRKYTMGYTLQAFEPGLLELPPVMLLPRDGADTVKSDFLTLKVLPVEVDTIAMQIMPPASVAAADMRWTDYIPLWIFWVLAAIAVLAGAYVAYIKLRRHHEKVIEEAAKPLPPYELAIGRLSQLRNSNIANMGHEKQFYTELTEILRQYLHGRFGINAMEMTSGQIIKALRSNPETRLPAERVNDVLRIADFVKFAKERPLAEDNNRAMMRATEFVETTKPAPEPAPEPEAKK